MLSNSNKSNNSNRYDEDEKKMKQKNILKEYVLLNKGYAKLEQPGRLLLFLLKRVKEVKYHAKNK